MKTSLTLRQAVPQLQEDDAFKLNALASSTGSNSPWYVRLFIGISAWIAAILLIAFLALARILTNEAGAVFIGFFFCAIAVVINRLNPRNDFMRQLGLALSLAGQPLLIGGLALTMKITNVTGIAIMVIILESVLLLLFQDRVHRFLSTVIIVAAMVTIIFDLKMFEAIHILIGVLAATVILLYWSENDLLSMGMQEFLYPVSYGITVSLFGLLILPFSNPLSGMFQIEWWWLSAVLLFAALLFLIVLIARGLGVPLWSWQLIGLLLVCVILVIPATRMPGILGALILLVLGFWRNHRVLIGLAGVFLVFYISAYYYTLEWTLLQKSLALLTSGILLLALRFVLLRTRKASVT